MTVEKSNHSDQRTTSFSLSDEHVQRLLTQHTKREWKNDQDGQGEYLDHVVDHVAFAQSIMIAMREAMASSPLASAQLPELPEPWIVDGSVSVQPESRHHYAEDQMLTIRNLAYKAGFAAGKKHEAAAYDRDPVLWFEADKTAINANPRDVIGAHKMLYSTRTNSEKPTGENPSWPLYLHGQRRADMSIPQDLVEAHDWIVYLRKRTDQLVAIINQDANKPEPDGGHDSVKLIAKYDEEMPGHSDASKAQARKFDAYLDESDRYLLNKFFEEGSGLRAEEYARLTTIGLARFDGTSSYVSTAFGRYVHLGIWLQNPQLPLMPKSNLTKIPQGS